VPDHFTLLLEWRRNEAATRGLAKLPPDFYAGTQTYLAELKRSYEADLRENPSGRKGEISRQTYQRASSLARDIVEGRVQKILTSAFQSSIGGARDLPNALGEERAMFDHSLGVLLEYRRTAAPYLEPSATTSPRPPAPSLPPVAAVPAAATSSPSSAGPAARPVASPTYVRIIKESRPIEVGPDTIDLRADDVLSLPAETARLLIEAKIAEPVQTSPSRPVT
jgi:DNA replication initiation complex subunit (GINS family)